MLTRCVVVALLFCRCLQGVRGYPFLLQCDDSTSNVWPNGLMKYGVEYSAMDLTWLQFNSSEPYPSDPGTEQVTVTRTGGTASFDVQGDGFAMVALIVGTGSVTGDGSTGTCDRIRYSAPSGGVVSFDWSGSDDDELDWVVLRSNGASASRDSQLLFSANAVDASGECARSIEVGSDGEIGVTTMVSPDTATLVVSVAQHSWAAVAFSTSGLMTQPLPSRALVMHSDGEGGVAVDPYLLENQMPSGVWKLNSTMASQYGLDIQSWSTYVRDDGTAKFVVTLDRSGIEDSGYLIAAVGSDSFDLAYHGSSSGNLALDSDWLTTCTNATEDTCYIENEAQVCFDCGRCSYEQTSSENANFSAYTLANNLTLSESFVATSNYKVSWHMEPPLHGSNVTRFGTAPYVHMLVQAQGNGWVGIGFMRDGVEHGMQNTDIYWGGTDENGDLIFVDAFATSIRSPVDDTSIGGTADAFDVKGSREDGIISLEFKRLVKNNDSMDVDLVYNSPSNCVWAYSVSDEVGLNMYHRYNRGFMQLNIAQVDCNNGEHIVGESCVLCEPGEYCPDRLSKHECPPGEYADKPGLLSCISCDNSPNVGYANQSGSTFCTDCPANTERTVATSFWQGSRVEECVCKPGFYEPDGLRGRPCLACPTGGKCLGGTEPPRALPGYWGILDHPGSFTLCSFQDNAACTLSTNLTIEAAFASLDNDGNGQLSPAELSLAESLAPSIAQVLESAPRLAEPGNVSYRVFLSVVNVDPSGTDSYVPHNASGKSMCQEGYTGELCAVCEEGYFRFDVGCFQCPDDNATSFVFMLFGVAAVILLWIVVAQAAGWLGSDAFDILLLFLQCVSIIMSFDLQFHPWVTPLAPIFTLAAFNMDILNPTCVVAWDYSASSLLQLLLPIVVLIVSVVRQQIITCVIKRRHDGQPVCCDRCLRVPSNQARATNALIANTTSFMYLVYTELVVKSLTPFQLITLPDDRVVMKVAPYIEAWSTEHIGLQVVPGIFGIMVYVIGVPLTAVVYLRSLKHQHLLADDDTLDRLQWLYGKYHLRVYYWETIVLVRRLVLCVVLVCLDKWPLMQGTVSLGFLVGVLCAQFYSLPFRRNTSNLIDTAFIAVLINLNFVGLMFDAGVTAPEVLAVVLLLALAGSIGVAMVTCVFETKDTMLTRKWSKELRMPDVVLQLFASEIHKVVLKLDRPKVAEYIAKIHEEMSAETGENRSVPGVYRRSSSGQLIGSNSKRAEDISASALTVTLHGSQAVLEKILTEAWGCVQLGADIGTRGRAEILKFKVCAGSRVSYPVQ